MFKIYKKELRLVNRQQIALPRKAKILRVAFQNDILCLWYLHDPDVPIEIRNIRVYGTGETISEHVYHLASLEKDPFIWHIFMEYPPKDKF